MLKISRPSDPRRQIVEFRTDFGSASARWCGGHDVTPGRYSVEFEIDRDDLHSGHDVCPAARQQPGVRVSGDKMVLCGVLEAASDGHVDLRLGIFARIARTGSRCACDSSRDLDRTRRRQRERGSLPIRPMTGAVAPTEGGDASDCCRAVLPLLY